MRIQNLVLVNVGVNETLIFAYRNKKLLFKYDLPFGEEYLIRDLSAGLRISFYEAKKILERYKKAKGIQYVLAKRIDGKIKRIKISFIKEIINARVEEILFFAAEKLKSKDFYKKLHPKIILIGKFSRLRNIQKIATDILEQSVDIR